MTRRPPKRELPRAARCWSNLPFPRLGDEPWQQAAVGWLLDMAGPHEGPLFGLMRSHRYALDYLMQAPVLLTASSQQLAKEIDRGGRLRDILRRLDYAPQLRKLGGRSALVGDGPLFLALSRLNPSALAQAIPDGDQTQRCWVRSLVDWRMTMARRERGPEFLFDWAAIHASSALAAGLSLRDLADYIGTPGAAFRREWTVERAKMAAEAWHLELAKSGGAARTYKRFGYDFDQPIDYGDLPVETELEGLRVVALRSGADLHLDGQRMRHCVASYGTDVLKGKCRIYSIRKGEKPLATLELVRTKRRWHLGQVKGPCNAAPDGAVMAVAAAFLASLPRTTGAA